MEQTGQFQLVASCAVGLEKLVGDEFRTTGGKDIVLLNGAVTGNGSLETAYRLCLWSRFASRIFLQLAAFPIADEDDLYKKAVSFAWEKHLCVENTFAVNASLRGKTKIVNNRFAALRLKDALVDCFRNLYGMRPSVATVRPDVQFHLHIDKDKKKDRAVIYLDLSGEGLHRRGYRVASITAPLKENLAAGIVGLSGWQRDEALIDPMCGSGTLLIEAAMMFGDVAPGLSRSYFGFWGWSGHDADLWEKLVAEAVTREERGLNRKWPLFLGYDADPLAVSAARKNVVRAGLGDFIQIRQGELANLAPPCKAGTIVSNLPFGERLLEKETVSMLYRAVGRIARERFFGWKLAVFISHPEFTDSFLINWQRKERLFHGGMACRLLLSSLPFYQKKEFLWELPVNPLLTKGSEDLANRLRKNFSKINNWAKKEGVFCYRLYDRDLPEYNFSIDLYEKWFHIQEYAPPKAIDRAAAAKRIKLAIQTVQAVFNVRSNRIFVKRKERQSGNRQYQKERNSQKMVEVREGAAFLLVNLTDYVDTGLFLDHRPMRKKIYTEAKGKRFLNLFAYTATATVQAQLGGATQITTVDLSARYLDWARKNLALNGLSESRHTIIRMDVIAWLQQAKGLFDIIFIDPPTFSNTKKEKRVFDIQRDHLQLIRLAMNHLDQKGVVYFSTNFRRFKLDELLFSEYAVADITRSTIPFDFQRDKKVHQCWQLRWPNP